MVEYLSGPVQHDAFFRKYASKKFLKGKSKTIAASHYKLPILTYDIASIVLRQWAKKSAHKYLEIEIVDSATPVI